MADKYVKVSSAGLAGSAGLADGTSWVNCFGLAEWVSDLVSGAAAGDTYWVEEGTYTLTAGMTTLVDGTAIAPIFLMSVKSGTTNEPPTPSDWSDPNAGALIAAGANAWSFDNSWVFFRFQYTGTNAIGWAGDSSCKWIECSINNTSTGDGINIGGTGSTVLFCDIQSASGIGIDCDGQYCYIKGNYIHDSTTGMRVTSVGTFIDDNKFANISGTHLNITNEGSLVIMHSSGAGDGADKFLASAGGDGHIILNNSMTEFTDTAMTSTTAGMNILDYNNFNGNGADVDGFIKGPNTLNVAPSYTSATGGDLTTAPASLLRNAARPDIIGVG